VTSLAVRLDIPPETLSAIAALVVPLVLGELQRSETRHAHELEYLTVAEAAQRLRAKPQRVYDLLSAGRLRRYKDGARVLVKSVELEAYLASSAARGATPCAPRRAAGVAQTHMAQADMA
jgi:excisionase family DNA binding protein